MNIRSAVAAHPVITKLLATAALVGTAASVAGLGTFASFTSSTSASQSVGSGTVAIALGTAGANNRLSTAASGIVPGDTIERAATITDSGSQGLAAITLTTTAPTSSLLDTDATNGLQLDVQKCSVAWTETGTAPAYGYTCGGTTTTVLASRAVIGSNVALTGLSALAPSGVDYLRVRLTLPTTADNTFQGLSSTINYAFTGTQRVAAAH